MFGFNKNRPMIEGPIEFEMEIEIERPSSDVFRLIDIADPEFAHKQRGASVTQLDESNDRFCLKLPEMDDLSFNFHVTDRVAGERHTAECIIEPRVGNLVKSVEEYSVKPKGEDACLLVLKMNATFDDNLSDEEVAGEIAMMSMAVQDDLVKLKVHAEEGVEAVAALDEDPLGDLDFDNCDIDLDDLEFGEYE